MPCQCQNPDEETPMRRAWLIATESPHLPILAFLAYWGVKHLATGTASVPEDLQGSAPSWLIWTWALSLVLGAVLGAVGLVTERMRVESVGLVWSLFGLAFYTADREAGAAVVLLAAMCAIRLNALRRARRNHARIVALLTSNGQQP